MKYSIRRDGNGNGVINFVRQHGGEVDCLEIIKKGENTYIIKSFDIKPIDLEDGPHPHPFEEQDGRRWFERINLPFDKAVHEFMAKYGVSDYRIQEQIDS